MQFLNPWFLLGTLTVVAPILVHLIRKDDSRKIPFSSLMFVTRLPKKSLRLMYSGFIRRKKNATTASFTQLELKVRVG